MSSMFLKKMPIEKGSSVHVTATKNNSNKSVQFSRENLALKTLTSSKVGQENMFYNGQRIENVDNDFIVKSLQVTTKTTERRSSLFGFVDTARHLAFNGDIILDAHGSGQTLEKFNKQFIQELVHSLRIKCPNLIIENVYQEKYGDLNASGIGDFLRGSYFIMQFCDEYGFSYNINMAHHPVAEFLEVYENQNQKLEQDEKAQDEKRQKGLFYHPLDKVSVFGKNNFTPVFLPDNVLSNRYNEDVDDNFIYFLKQQETRGQMKGDQMKGEKLLTYVISYPKTPLKQKYKAFMQQLLKPTDLYLNEIYSTLNNIGLQAKRYVVVHIRYGDKFLLENQGKLYTNHIQIIEKTIKQIDLNDPIFLIADNDMIKSIMTKMFPHIKTHHNSITHTGEGIKLEREKLENTMTDFYFFAMSKRIMAFSVYSHGTGFSKWAAETYDVPYVCRHLPLK